ncbi:MAG: helix-turn-helix domain-containing protein [Solirubrobacteraceae bacterium]
MPPTEAQQLYPADPRLRPLLQRDPLAFSRSGAEAARWLEPPRPVVTIMIDLEGGLFADGVRMPDAWVGGLGESCTEVTVAGAYSCLDLKLTPLGAYRLLGGIPLGELGGQPVAVSELFGRDGSAVVDRIRDASSWERRFQLTEAFLLARADDGPAPAPFVEWAWRRIVSSRGRVRVGELAAEIGCSRRHLQAKFTEQVGVSPKTAIRLTRFQHVCSALRDAPGRWAELAAEAGYADQPHFNRDFRELAGTTPTEFLRRGGAAIS